MNELVSYGFGGAFAATFIIWSGWIIWSQRADIRMLIDRLTGWSAPDGGGWCRRCGAITGNDAPHQPWCPTTRPTTREEDDDYGSSGS